MFKHILIPIDGSELSGKAIEAGVEFARQVRARITGFIAVPEYKVPNEAELMSRRGLSMAQHEEQGKRKAEAALLKLSERARAAGVEYDEEFVQSDFPYEAIIGAAQRHACDLIFMASHGRRGLSALIHGSETQGVLTHSTIPTMVYR
jgi:nucleotide-binding universal stress UspA family protein